METPAILAIDPAAKSGWAFSRVKDHVGASGVWTLGPIAEDRPAGLADQIRIAHRKFKPTVIAYEVATFGGKNLHAMRRLNELAGVIQAVGAELGCEAWAFGITTWKARLGNGGMDKPGVVRVLKNCFGITVACGDEGDAVGILIAAQMGPPPESKRKRVKRLAKELKARQPALSRMK